MLIKPSLVSFLVGMGLCVHLRCDILATPSSKTKAKADNSKVKVDTSNAKSDNSKLKDLAAFVVQDMPLLPMPIRLNQEIVIYVRKKMIRELMKQIFPQYNEVQDQITQLVTEIRQNEEKYKDESIRQKLLSLSREQSVLEQAELNLIALATKALVSRLNDSSTEPIVFSIRVVDEEREVFPDFTKFPEIKTYQEHLANQFSNEFLKVYQNIRDQEEARRKAKKKSKKPKANKSTSRG